MPRRRVSFRSVLRQELRGYADRTFSDLGFVSTNPSTLSPAEIQQFAANAGFSGADLATAVAVALAESLPSGNPNSYNPETRAGTPQGKGSYGLWQIYLNKHPEFAGWNLLDPQTNANAAFSVYQQAGGFTPWATFNSGAYRAYLAVVPSFSSAGFVSTNPAPPAPLTIDMNTGLPVDDATSTPGRTPAQIIGLTLLGVGAYLAADWFLGD